MKTVNKFIAVLFIAGLLALSLAAPASAQTGSGTSDFSVASVNNHAKRIAPYSARFYHPYVYRNIGAEIRKLPLNCYQFNWGPYQYYYAEGVFYQAYANGRYKIAAPPVGAEVPSLPFDSEIITIDDNPYYLYKGIYYDCAVKPGGKFAYKVIGTNGIRPATPKADPDLPLVGDMTDRLPDGCHKVVLKGKPYWITPNEVYLEKVENERKTAYRVVAIPEEDQNKAATI
jgi:hypothetical protein